MKKYNNKSNVIGNLIKTYRNKKGLSKIALCKKLQLFAVYIDSAELKRMEDGIMIIKDFELLALCKVLDINYDELKSLLD